MVDKLVNFSFEEAFEKHYDFFADIFEYLIKDYNTAGGGKYAEYYTPHAIATIMARLLVGNATDLHSIECYDPSAGTGTLFRWLLPIKLAKISVRFLHRIFHSEVIKC